MDRKTVWQVEKWMTKEEVTGLKIMYSLYTKKNLLELKKRLIILLIIVSPKLHETYSLNIFTII